jgi:AcrR family transcriptional regulator
MPRPRTVEEEELLGRLALAFSEEGFEGTSLSRLSEASGLGRASLYHRFPGGKRQMAEEVLARAGDWIGREVLAVLSGPGTPRERASAVARSLDAFYAGGTRACLLNMLAAPRAEGPFGPAIRAAMESLAEGFAALAREAGAEPDQARTSGERALAEWQGSLVLARGLGSPEPFRAFLRRLPKLLLEEDA